MGAVTNQPAGCPVWYQIETEEAGLNGPVSRYDVVYMDREATTDLVQQGKPVPPGFIQFNPHANDPNPQRARLGATGQNPYGMNFRVRAMNAIGLRGVWSDYRTTYDDACRALGFVCGGQ